MPEPLPGPLYPSYQAAMADPHLNRFSPWFVTVSGPPVHGEPVNFGDACPEWDGWQAFYEGYDFDRGVPIVSVCRYR